MMGSLPLVLKGALGESWAAGDSYFARNGGQAEDG